ncbi:Alcohol dehydrogenase superfamily, zinc-type [Cordyceps fumosorosea ARSEF 2679]|uniref:Alcohol dehydrogenase superfamily, zinc-type n=1 Tax=Cordyceps fumosorosea (strain ARSEF 2679) TaxID=1081104 RepID=A0A168ESI1_CORFA|nr:Alcohol dehydrogenase superfamily, zinc-type [Cordyceps fumosorosea ARSEF 2679]OAA74158.1 Alcohol dehydrogenase superfamily, zinc-type [Cordyceps fumosorosea ARSEF 2679]
MAAIPSTMKALVAVRDAAEVSAPSSVAGRGATLRDVPVPSISGSEILVKVTAVVLNPTDFKHIDLLSPEGAVIGCDYAGVVAKVGGDATGSWKVGDRVAGWVHGGLYEDRGSFAQFLKVDADLAWKVPDGVSDLAAATYGVSATTAVLGLQKHLGLPWPETTTTTTTTGAGAGEPILVYAASTGAGLYAVRLAKLAGRTVVATASPHNFDLVRRYGADAVFDYKSPTAAADIRAAYPGLRQAFDGISENGTTEFCAAALQPGGSVVVLLPPKAAEIDGVKVQHILAYTLFGREFHLLPPRGPKFPASAEDRAVLARFYALLPGIVGKLEPIPVKELPGGLEGLGEGLNLLREGKVSGTKLGYKLE